MRQLGLGSRWLAWGLQCRIQARIGYGPSEQASIAGAAAGAVDAIYDAALDPSRWSHALRAIADCFGDVGAVLLWRKDDGSFGTIVSDALLEAQRDYEEGGWASRDIRAIRGVERGYFFNGIPATDSHLCAPDEINSDPFYTEFLTRHGLGWVAAIAVSPDPHVGAMLSVQRASMRKPGFSDGELDLLARIGRHTEKSLRLSIRLLDAELARMGLGEALARIGIGVFALDHLAELCFPIQPDSASSAMRYN